MPPSFGLRLKRNPRKCLSSGRPTALFDAFTAALRDPSADIREQAAFGLGQIRDKRAIAPLTQALKDATEKGAIGGDRRCDIQFRARKGVLEVLVTSNAGRLWQTEILIP